MWHDVIVCNQLPVKYIIFISSISFIYNRISIHQNNSAYKLFFTNFEGWSIAGIVGKYQRCFRAITSSFTWSPTTSTSTWPLLPSLWQSHQGRASVRVFQSLKKYFHHESPPCRFVIPKKGHISFTMKPYLLSTDIICCSAIIITFVHMKGKVSRPK